MESLTLELKTLTPIWTGGVDGTAGRLHASGIIGSLRWWYEVIVRGLDLWVSDPTSDNPEQRSIFDAKAYEQAKREGKSAEEALAAGLTTVCPVSYIFGATGWSRQFHLQLNKNPKVPLHFRSSLKINKTWLENVFTTQNQNSLDTMKVTYGDVPLVFHFRGFDTDYVKSQLLLILNVINNYASLGAKPQHGFGVIQLSENQRINISNETKTLKEKVIEKNLSQTGPAVQTNYILSNFVSLSYKVPSQSLSIFSGSDAHLGHSTKGRENQYLPCAFDLRYKGSNNWGMRNWLENTENWEHQKVNKLFGVSKKKGEPEIQEDERTASNLCFSMPYKLSPESNDYAIRIFGFAPPDVLTPKQLGDLCQEYMKQAFHDRNLKPENVMLGKDYISDINRNEP